MEVGLGIGRKEEEEKGYCVVGRLPGRQALQCEQAISKSIYKKVSGVSHTCLAAGISSHINVVQGDTSGTSHLMLTSKYKLHFSKRSIN